MLKVNLFDGKDDSGKVTVYVLSEVADKKKSKSLDVGRITARTGDSNIERIVFRFSEKELPPNGAFSACVVSNDNGGTQCEQADRHHNASRHLQSCGPSATLISKLGLPDCVY